MAHTFTSPYNSNYVAQILPESKGPERNLFRHFRRRPRAANVFLLSDGTVISDLTTDTPIVVQAGAVPYPWNPNDPSGPYASYLDALGVQQYINHPSPWVTKVLWSAGAPQQITDAQYTQLVAAGYGSCCT